MAEALKIVFNEQPRRPGWYWLQLRENSEWVIDLVRPDWLDKNELFFSVSGRRVATNPIYAYYGPLVPPAGFAAETSAARIASAYEVEEQLAKIEVKSSQPALTPNVGDTAQFAGKTVTVKSVDRKGRGFNISFKASNGSVAVVTLTEWNRMTK